jgi:hypothetical protein
MRRHHIPGVIPLLALVALPAGLLAGCGGGSTASGHPATTRTVAAAQQTTTSSSATTTRHSSTTRPARTARTAKPSPHAFAAAAITPAAASHLAQSGTLVLPVAVGGPGTVSAFGQAELPSVGIVHVADARPMAVRRAGVVDLTLTLTPAARRRLAAGRSIVTYVAVSFSKGDVFQRMKIVLRP